MFDLQEELKKIPTSAGVYLMFDEKDIIIYVGKAKNLKNRVRQYFMNSNQTSVKVSVMVKKIVRFEYIVVNSEVSALILENNLIKKYEPKYNIKLKDDKTYPYAKITINDEFPRVFTTRTRLNDKAKYFGPYTDIKTLNDSIELIHKIFPIRTCHLNFPRDLNKKRPCLNYHIEKCKAPCNEKISKEEYDEMICKIIDFFDGKYGSIISELEHQMKRYSEDMEYEKATEIRNKIFAIKKLMNSQLVENMDNEDRDIIAFARARSEAVFQLFIIRNGKLVGREHFMLDNVEHIERGELMEIFVKQFYGGTPYIPKNISLEEDIPDRENIETWLSSVKGQKVIISIPKKGEKLKLIQMAHKNAIIMLDKFGDQLKKEYSKTKGAILEIQNALNIKDYLGRIEAYDISNTQGVQSVGSMVVFEDGKPLRTDYRKFKIKTVIGPNDYASIREIISRRFARYKDETSDISNINSNNKFNKIPDIIFIDGGRGQVNIVSELLKNLEIDIPVCGMVKDDFHKTRGLLFNNQEIDLKRTSEGFKLVTRIQDEVHRFAIEYHRKAREKAVIRSILDDISGIGDKRKKALLRYFGSIDNIRNAEVSELLKVEGINLSVAKNVYHFFR